MEIKVREIFLRPNFHFRKIYGSFDFMTSSLTTHFQEIEHLKHQLLERLRGYGPEVLSNRPAPQRWSILQVLSHLITAEKLSVAYIRKKKLGIATAGNTGPWEAFKFFLLKVSQRIGFKYRAPKTVVEHTPSYESLDVIQTEWAHVRLQLKSLLEEFDEKDLRKKIYKHPFAGRINIQQAIIFFGEHMRHHQPQINRLLH
jgi:uncharacterized damage-inducible protein DinB